LLKSLPGHSLRRAALALAVSLAAGWAGAQSETPSTRLSTYLSRAADVGINVIYSSSVVPATQTVDIAPEESFSIARLREALIGSGLILEELSPGNFLLRRAPRAPAEPQAMESEAPVLEEVVVHSSVYRWSRRSDEGTYLANETLVQRPVLANDVFRVVNQLPGSASVGVSARPRVRGGRDDETLIEFDRVRLYKPFHFAAYNSLYSVFDERLVAELEFHGGAYPLDLGDSLSAALRLNPPRGDELGDRRELGVGLYQLSYLHNVETRKGSLLANVRRSGPETGHLLDEDALRHPTFGDVFLRYERQNDDGALWNANLLWYGDDIHLGGEERGESADSSYNSAYAWLSRDSAPGSAVETATSFGAAYLESRRAGDVDQPGKVTGSLSENLDFLTLFANQDYVLDNSRRAIFLGWDYRYSRVSFATERSRRVDPLFAGLSGPAPPYDGTLDGQRRLRQGSAYFGWKHRIDEGLYLDLGARLEAWHQSREGTSRLDVMPAYRLAMLYEVLPDIDLRVAVGRYNQVPALIDLTFADLDVPMNQPQSARKLAASIDWMLPFFDARLTAEIYRKDAYRINPYFDNLTNSYTLLPELQPDRVRIDAHGYRADGIELGLEVPLSRVTLWMNYALSSARDYTPTGPVRRSWDQGRTLNVGLQGRIGAWNLGLSGTYHEGWLTTPLLLEEGIVSAGRRNSRRFDHFISLDIKAVRRWQFARGELRLEAGFGNVADRQNTVGVDYFPPPSGVMELSTTAFMAPPRTVVFDLFWSF
jgi:hypothetical protein